MKCFEMDEIKRVVAFILISYAFFVCCENSSLCTRTMVALSKTLPSTACVVQILRYDSKCEIVERTEHEIRSPRRVFKYFMIGLLFSACGAFVFHISGQGILYSPMLFPLFALLSFIFGLHNEGLSEPPVKAAVLSYLYAAFMVKVCTKHMKVDDEYLEVVITFYFLALGTYLHRAISVFMNRNTPFETKFFGKCILISAILSVVFSTFIVVNHFIYPFPHANIVIWILYLAFNTCVTISCHDIAYNYILFSSAKFKSHKIA